MRATLTILPSLANFGKRGFSFNYVKESEMNDFEREVLSDMSKMLRLQLDRPLKVTIWDKIENAAVMAVVTFLATWWVATIIRL
jgi:hypothetical protein